MTTAGLGPILDGATDPFDRVDSASSFTELVDAINELADVSYVDAEALFFELEAKRRRLEAEQLAFLQVIEERKQFRNDGHSTVFGLLRSAAHWSEAECRSRTKLARLVADFPDVGDSLREGRISVANAETIARLYANPDVSDRFESVLGNLLREAELCEHDDFKLLPERWELIVDKKTAQQHDDAQRGRDVQFTIRNGRGRLVVEWGELDSVRNLEILDRFVDDEFEADWNEAKQRYGAASIDNLRRTNAQRRADAVSKIFERAISTPPGSKAPKPVGTVVIDYNTMNDLLSEAGVFPEQFTVDPFDDPTPLISRMRCNTIDGMPISPTTALQVLLEGYVRFAVMNDKGVPIALGREHRLFEGAARDAVELLSPRCTHPGCRVKASRAEIDHNKPWSEGGMTNPDNGGPKCRRHNKMKYKKRWRDERDSDGHFRTYRDDGTELR